jgi:NAD(P)-dependent dehydrogenase (short-subunit alcohol dehydrogenase family)
MKDAYSFDHDVEGLESSYKKMYEAYCRIFTRCALPYIPVEADPGMMGGSMSHEFMVPAETGENDVVYCESGKYAANIEKAISRGPVEGTPTESSGAAPDKFATPGVVTIEALAAAPYGVSARHQIKTLVFVADSKPILVLIRGDDSLNEAKLMAKTGAVQVRQATADEIVELLGARPGSLGAVSATLKTPAVPVYADEALRGARGMTTGANEDGFHLRHVEVDRDLKVTAWYDLRTVKVGESCVETQQPLKIRRAIEGSYDRFHDFERTMQLNYFGCLRVTMGLLPSMVAKRKGHVVNISSIGVLTNAPRFSAYVASKAALDAWTRCASSEFADQGITFTTINMPLVRTPMIAPTKLYEDMPTIISPEEAADMIADAIIRKPQRIATRLGVMAEIMHLVMPKMSEVVMNSAYRMFPDSAAAQGNKGGDAQRVATREAMIFASLMRGIHW